MLIDQLLTLPIQSVSIEGYAPLLRRLAQAQKFELASDFAAAAEEIAYDLKTVAGALPYCRLPYPLTWVEVAQAHRPRFSASGIHMPSIQSHPSRVGFLLEAMDDKLKSFAAYQFWELRSFPDLPHASHICMMFDPEQFIPTTAVGEIPLLSSAMLEQWKKIQADMLTEAPLIETLIEGGTPGQSPEWMAASQEVQDKLVNTVMPGFAPYVDKAVLKAEPRLVKSMADVGLVDWAGEAIYVLSTLALMNTLNATESVAVDQRRLNKARVKNRKHPLAAHHILKIHPRLKRHVVGDRATGGHRELCKHMVKGHWKVRRSGIYFWRPHTRGKGRFVDKTYVVE